MTDYLQIDNQRIAYTEAGSSSSPPVLFLHGIVSHKGVWTQTIDILKNDYHCIAIDHLGFGESDKPKGADYSIAKHGERALQVANHFGFEQFILVGHSMGGQIATYLTAVTVPNRVQRLISVGGVVTGKLSDTAENFMIPIARMAVYLPMLYPLSRRLCQWRPYAEWVYRAWFYNAKKISFSSWEMDRYFATDIGLVNSAIQTADSLAATDLTQLLQNISIPTSVLFGKQDGTVPVDQALLFKEKLPTVNLELIDECGHFPMYEKFDEYMQHMQRFLKQ